ncbi:DUF4369 domain-containing protein [Niabella aquatica]
MNFKKFAFATIFMCFCFLSFAQRNKLKGFEIKGRIDGIENGTKVYLYDLDGQNTLDSAISAQGKFTFKGYVEKPTICWIWVKNPNEAVTIMVENTQMTFQSPINHMDLNAVVKGGKEQDLQNELRLKQYPYDKVFYTAFDSVTNKLYPNDESKNRLIEICNNAQTASHNIYVEFGKQHPNSVLGQDIIYRNRQRIEKDTVKTLVSQMSGQLQSTLKGQSLMAFATDSLIEVGKQFIDFDATSLNGDPFKLSSLKGNYILLDFWSRGCGPCRAQNRIMSRKYNRIKDKISIVSFSIDKHKSDWAKSSEEDNILWINVSDLEGDNGSIKTIYDVQAIPTSYLINKEGIVVEKFVGFEGDNFINKLEKLIAEK